jgi:hypothetical protein
VGDSGFSLADGARRRLLRLFRDLDASRELVIDRPRDGRRHWLCTFWKGGSTPQTR